MTWHLARGNWHVAGEWRVVRSGASLPARQRPPSQGKLRFQAEAETLATDDLIDWLAE